MNTVAVTADSKTIEMIEVALIQVSPDNPRKTFDQKALEELAASIAAEGVLFLSSSESLKVNSVMS